MRCLIISLWIPFFVDPSVSLKWIFAFSVGGLLAFQPICLNLPEESGAKGEGREGKMFSSFVFAESREALFFTFML